MGLTGAGAQFDISAANGDRTIGALAGVAGSSIALGAHTLTLGNGTDTIYAGTIGGTGGIVKQGSGTTTFSGANSYTGATTINAGTLQAGATNTLSSASAHSVASGASLATGGFDQQVASLSNSGRVDLRNPNGSVGSTLTVTGAYVGNGGVMQIGTTLGDSSSPTDRLLLSGAGASASGHTVLEVTNAGGLGALTTGNGITVVATENAASIGANAFSLLNGHVDAGAFEYRLFSDAQGAYLRSSTNTPMYRGETPLLAALPEQLREANLAMLGQRQLRMGTMFTGERANSGRQAWARLISVQRDIRQDGDVSASSHGRLNGVQAGTDVYAGGNTDAQWQAGVYVGQLDGKMGASGLARGVAGLQVGTNKLRNQYLGLYGNYQTNQGLYAEAVLQAGDHRYQVASASNAGADARGKGSSLLASLEVGQTFELASGWRLQPQLQIVHQRLDLDELALSGATQVSQAAKSNWTARAGLRVQNTLFTGMGRLMPYARVDMFKSTNGTDSAGYRTAAALTTINSKTGGMRTELAAGATLSLSANTSLYGELGRLVAGNGQSRTKSEINASLGVRVRW